MNKISRRKVFFFAYGRIGFESACQMPLDEYACQGYPGMHMRVWLSRVVPMHIEEYACQGTAHMHIDEYHY